MDKELREKMIAKARENGDKHGKAAELDFGAGAEWMYEQLVKNNAVLPHVSERVWTVDEIISVLETSEDADEHTRWFDKHGR